MDLGRVAKIDLGEVLAIDALAIPHRDAVSPPQLPADAPVLDGIQPMEIDLRPAFRVELDVSVPHRRLGLLDAWIP